MIKIENTSVVGWEAAIRGMRNPMNSWHLSDSGTCADKLCDCENYVHCHMSHCIGPNDLDLMTRLRNAGMDHRKFMRMIIVTFDLTAPLYWWKEFDTYKIGTVANSCSTMHKIHAKEFTLDDFSHEHLINEPLVESEPGVVKQFNLQAESLLEITVAVLNAAREMFLRTKEKKYWWQMIQLLPTSYNQKRTILLNYEVLANIYKSRRNHKLDEWVELCKWIEGLPYARELICGVDQSS